MSGELRRRGRSEALLGSDGTCFIFAVFISSFGLVGSVAVGIGFGIGFHGEGIRLHAWLLLGEQERRRDISMT